MQIESRGFTGRRVGQHTEPKKLSCNDTQTTTIFLNTRFFVDDGFSGVSFDREGLQEMLAEVEAGHGGYRDYERPIPLGT